MIVKEFEGKNEKEAIDRAIEELGLDRNEIDFEIVEAKRPGILFRTGKVKIRVHVTDEPEESDGDGGGQDEEPEPRRSAKRGTPVEPSGEFETGIIDFTKGLLERMGFPAEITVSFREEGRLGLDIESDGSGILIGKQGKTLEALQFIVNLAAGRMDGDTRIVLDTQDYRSRRERALIRMANQVAEQVRRNGESQLLEPLNPFERRLIHTSLARYGDIETVSEGDGLYKRIRVIARDERGGNRG
jgi:spoIIIJ-associated protein